MTIAAGGVHIDNRQCCNRAIVKSHHLACLCTSVCIDILDLQTNNTYPLDCTIARLPVVYVHTSCCNRSMQSLALITYIGRYNER